MSALLAWLVAHEAVLAGLAVGILDFVISINPKAASNSIIEWLLAEAKSLLGGGSAPAP